MQIQAAKIEVDRADDCADVITHKHLRMYKPRRIFKNFNSCPDQPGIIRLRQSKGILLIRNMGHNNRHIHTTLCRKGQGGNHLLIQNQIWRHDMYIIDCPVYDIKINILRQILIVNRAVSIRHDISTEAAFVRISTSRYLP